ncbi:inactive glucose-1-phosphate adenylyltransferase small subunit 2, chloroplastic isoform X2 [Spinacia oleracea]|uniref:Inactive glucose-1-phosphate adenylyltransferase small subunit 2, chloroplastic isoform X2 n=1 Tax=Spinacia oleracea TaxID=3562 RepID=A0A9R0IU23_SPIOL|nr:inactive glucose-1-phosphate adenylyltransferase small subunit 2, chloroplastic isoform X2 [Spinacia oleracea]
MGTLQLTSIVPTNIKHQVLRSRHNEIKTNKFLLSVSSSLSMPNFQQADQILPFSPQENQNVAAILFGNGSDCKLFPLMRRRSAGAIPLGAKYRLIDAVVSNCINSNITKMFALTQFNSTSLNSHLTRTYSNVGLGREEFLQVIAACQSPGNLNWFQGNADAVRRFLWMLEECPATEFLILPGYHLYRMDYQEILQLHHETRADITISAIRSEERHDKGFGILKVNSDNKVIGLFEKDNTAFPLNQVGRLEISEENNCITYASMGIYVISKEVMVKILREDFPWANDFRSEVIPGAISLGMKVQAYVFDGYWENMQSIKGFYQASMESTKTTDIKFDFCDRDSPLYTLPRRLPPTRITDAVITDSAIGDGCLLNRCRIKSSVIGIGTRIDDAVVIEDSILMGSDIYQEDLMQNMETETSEIPIGIGQGSLIRNAIIDKNARIGKRVMIINKDKIQEGNREDDGYVIRDGIVIVTRSAIVPDGTVLL